MCFMLKIKQLSAHAGNLSMQDNIEVKLDLS